MLGTSLDVLSKDTSGNGHVSRNIRLSLAAIDMVEPYVGIVGVNDLPLSDDVVPLAERTCQTAAKKVMIPKNAPDITLEWTVGGAISIDETTVWFAQNLPDGSLDCKTQPARAYIEKTFAQGSALGATTGTGFFSPRGPAPHPSTSQTDIEPTLGPLFSAKIDVSNLKPNDRLTIIASARVDSSWQTVPGNVAPNVPPQSHVVNARTNPDWHHESAGKHVKGRLDWFSIPITIVVGDYDDSVGSQAGKELSTIEVSNRFGLTTGQFKGGISPSKSKSDSGAFMGLSWQAVAGILVVAVLCAVGVIVSIRRRQGDLEPIGPNDLYGDDGMFTAGGRRYTDNIEGDLEMRATDNNGSDDEEDYDDEPKLSF